MKNFNVESRSAVETKKIGEFLGRLLRGGDVVALLGELGAGKTTFVKGVARGLEVLGAEERVTSPTFAIVNEYQGRSAKIYHLDWYRLKSVRGEDRHFASECFIGGGISLIEWAERGKGVLPKERLEISFCHAAPRRRKIRIRAVGKKYEPFLTFFQKDLSTLARIRS